jgi:hypothetical protein
MKRTNDYAGLMWEIPAPKTVWMAIAVSLAGRLIGAETEDWLDNVKARLMEEWHALYAQGIVPQPPRAKPGLTRRHAIR